LRCERALDAAREAIPEAVEDLQRGWSTLPEKRRLGFLLFHLDFTAGQARTVEVRYAHTPTVDKRDIVPGVWTYEYLLSPARRWASFGPLDVNIRVPTDVDFSAALPFHREGNVLRAHFDALPDGELTFSVMPTRGRWLGLSRHEHYWAVLAAGMGLSALAGGAVASRIVAARPWWQRALFAVLAAGPLAALAAFAVLRLFLMVFPRHALGFDNGYFDRPSADFLVPFGGIAGALAALVSPFVGRRPAARARRAP
jgi:hypothetical protein